MFGYFAPGIYIQNLTRARRAPAAGLPDALDLMVICAEAGLSLDATLKRVSRELANSWPGLAEELGITAAELTFLPDRQMAFDNLDNRTDSGAIRAIVNTLTADRQVRHPAGPVVARSVRRIRAPAMTRAEEKAARLPAHADRADDPLHPADACSSCCSGRPRINIMDTFKH